MYCKYLSKTFQNSFKCKLYKKYISYPLCTENCPGFNLARNKPINKITNKRKQIEKNRFSIFTNDLSKCYYCGKTGEKMDLHEVWGGSNRQRSMKHGLIVPLCRTCHNNENIIMFLRTKLQKEYEKTHTREQFICLIGKNYL